MSLVEQELFTLPGHMSLPSISSRARFARSLVFCVVFYRSLFVLIWLAVTLSVLTRFMDCDYPFCFFNPAGTPGYRNGTESFLGLKGRPLVVRDVKIHSQPVLRMRRK